MPDRRIIGVDAATNLAAFVLDGETVATMTMEYDVEGDPIIKVESSVALEIFCERAVAVHGAGQ